MYGSSSSDNSLSCRGGKRSMIVGSSFSGFGFKRLWKNLAHRSRIRIFSRKSVPSSSLMNYIPGIRFWSITCHLMKSVNDKTLGLLDICGDDDVLFLVISHLPEIRPVVTKRAVLKQKRISIGETK